MSSLRERLLRRLAPAGSGSGTEALERRVDELDARTRADDDRNEGLTRELTADLTERVAALERRLAALEARDR